MEPGLKELLRPCCPFCYIKNVSQTLNENNFCFGYKSACH